MTKIALDLDDDTYGKLLELQLEKKKRKEPRSALNQIAADLLSEAVKKVNDQTKKPE
jgi:phosphoribosylformylglycinamidine (FGAM) synthase PurS component